MTLCRKCGKEIPDGQELCEACQNTNTEIDEELLNEIMNQMEESQNTHGEEEKSEMEESVPEELTTEDILPEEISFEEPETALPEEEPEVESEPLPEEEPEMESEPLPEEEPEAESEPLPEEEPEMESEPLPEEEPKVESEPLPEEEPEVESEPLPEEEPEAPFEEVPVEAVAEEEPEPETEKAEEMKETSEEEDINQLLDMLSDDYEENNNESKNDTEQSSEVDVQNEEQPVALEASLFSEEDEQGDIFADGMNASGDSDNSNVTMDDVFQNALSAVEYSSKEEEPMALDPFALEEEGPASEEEEPVQDIPVKKIEKKEKKAKSEDGFWKRTFGNIITDETAELEAKERAEELAGQEEKAKLKEERKQQAEAEKAEKAEQAKAEKERKAAAKAEKAAVKEAEKEKKKQLKMEREANEVVGKINPVGATIVMVFFGVVCLVVILGTQTFSYSRAVNRAEDSFVAGDYESAYNSLAGVNVSESSEEMQDKVRICMQLQKGINSYNNYYKMQMYLEALDSLMKGIRSYDTNRQKADEYGILNQYNVLEKKIATLLYNEFGVNEEQARSINNTDTQEAYTDQLEEIINRWSEKIKADER